MNTTRRIAWFVLIAVAAAFAISCGDDSTTPPPPNNAGYRNLSQKGNVLTNFELAHNRRDSSHYNALLDDNFTFFYEEYGVGGGTPVEWGRDVDATTTEAMFAAVGKLDFSLDNTNLTWDEIPAGAENWYAATVFYSFRIEIEPNTYIPLPGSKMQFIVRNAGTDSMPQWKLVELHDLGELSALKGSATRSAATEPTSYGKIKALFR